MEVRRSPILEGNRQGGDEEKVTVLEIIFCSVITGMVTWRFAVNRALVRYRQLAVTAETELQELTAEAQRWRTRATQLATENDAWKAGQLQGRADVMGIVPLLVAATQNRITCACGSTLSTLPPG
jgi:hypothetical protein